MKIRFLISAIISFYCQAFAGSSADTIYYSKSWQICEKEVADYYRVCTLHKGKDVHFTGAFADYNLLTNHVVSTGVYDSAGYRLGMFTYYYPNGEIRKQGQFANDEMSGLWQYFRYDGTLYFAGTFMSSFDMTPVYIYDWLADSVLLNGGTGRFVLYTDRFPDVFPDFDFILIGSVYRGVRHGDWRYFSHDSSQLAAREIYRYGEFISGVLPEGAADKPISQFNMEPVESRITNLFDYDEIFSAGKSKSSTADRIVRFLDSNVVPTLPARSTSYNNNLVFFGRILKNLFLYGADMPDKNSGFNNTELKVFGLYDRRAVRILDWYSHVPSEYQSMDAVKDERLLKICKANIPFRLHFRFHIRPEGTIENLTLDGSFPEDLKKRILYTLSRLSGLAANDKDAYTDLYFYSVAAKYKRADVTDFYISYYNRAGYH